MSFDPTYECFNIHDVSVVLVIFDRGVQAFIQAVVLMSGFEQRLSFRML